MNKANSVLGCLSSQTSTRTEMGMMRALSCQGAVRDSVGGIMIRVSQESRGMGEGSQKTSCKVILEWTPEEHVSWDKGERTFGRR